MKQSHSYLLPSTYSISDGVTLCSSHYFVTQPLFCFQFMQGSIFQRNLLSCKLSIVFKTCFANAVFSVRCTRVNELKKKGHCTCATHIYNTYKKHLPVYIYIHSSFIEPVEITALQIIIIIVDHCVNIMIYLFKKNQRMDTSIQETQALVLKWYYDENF